LYDLRNLFQVNVEEGRHLWAMVYLLQKYFGRDGREEAEELLRRRSGDTDSTRMLGAFNERTPDWLKRLGEYLDQVPSAVGEIGLDRWQPDLPYAGQEEAFLAQWQLAAARHLPVSIHCLRTWGRLYELLGGPARPAGGFVLHSFGGPAELIPALAKLGAYFSFPGYFLNARKRRQREAFRHVPAGRLLVETDAPDQLLPPEQNHFPLAGPDGQPLNQPANLAAVYQGLADFLGEPVASLAARVEENFQRLFGGIR